MEWDHQRSPNGRYRAGALLEGDRYLLDHRWYLGGLVTVITVIVAHCSEAANIVGMGPVPPKLPSFNHYLGLRPVNQDDDSNLHLALRIRESPFQIDVKVRQTLG